MCLELIEYIVVDAYAEDSLRHIEIYYKFIDKPLSNKRRLDLQNKA